MEISEFEGWLKKGLGRAILFLQNNDASPYRDVILYACTQDLRYDLEPSRARYLFDLLRLTKEPEFYRERILSSLQQPEEDEAPSQMFQIALLLAQEGDGAARRVMYATFAKNATEDDFTGAKELTRLDGLDAFLFVAEHSIDSNFSGREWEVNSWIDVLEERDGKKQTWQALEKIAVSIPEIDRLLEIVRQHRQARIDGEAKRKARHTHRPLNFQSIKQLIAEQGRKVNRPFLWNWGEQASQEELRQAAEYLIHEENADRIYAALHIFSKIGLPGDPEHLIQLAGGMDDGIVEAALDALAQIEHPTVRTLALEIAREPKRSYYAVELLCINYKDGDIELVEHLLEADMPVDDYHRLGISVRHLLEVNPTANGKRALTLVYEKGPCALCREFAVELLAGRDGIPDWMREECRYDANLNIREMVSSFKPSDDDGTTST